MSGTILHIGRDNRLTELREAPYDCEDILQKLVADYPNLLPGDQITPEGEPRQWLLISREMAVPDHEGGGAQWYLDHLFLDQDGIPTLVEVKRSTDTRIRREVVAQMLDYAANAAVYWRAEELRERYEANRQEGQEDFLSVLPGSEQDRYWESVDEHLHNGKLRLLFVADEIPASLLRIIEFLNQQMVSVQVLGVEVRQFVADDGSKLLVPKVVGQSALPSPGKKADAFSWDEETYLERALQVGGEPGEKLCERLLEMFRELGCQVYWGKGRTQAGFTAFIQGRQRHQLATVYLYKQHIEVETLIKHWKAPFDSEAAMEEVRVGFNEIPGVSISAEDMKGEPHFPLNVLSEPDSFAKYQEIYQDAVERIRQYEEK